MWDIRNVYPAITRQFASLVNKPQLDDVDAAMDQLEKFVVLLYNKLCTTSYVNVVRFDLFARKGRDVNDIPPTKGAFLQHARRATYQAGHCWGQPMEPQMVIIIIIRGRLLEDGLLSRLSIAPDLEPVSQGLRIAFPSIY